jgi:hypothetical protein
MIDDSKEYIICSAIWFQNGEHYPFQNVYGIDNGFVIGSFRHPMAMSVCPENPYLQDIRINEGKAALPFEWGGQWKECGKSKGTVQGFITSYGRFVDRKEAFIMALDAGQITRESILKTQGIDIDSYDGPKQLFSEDIFTKQWYYGTRDGEKVKEIMDLFENK